MLHLPMCYFEIMRAYPRSLLLLAALVCVSPVKAEVFKWVDESGVTHYSDRSPTVKSAEVVPERISVYKPDAALIRAMSAPRVDRRLENRINALERQLQQERLYRQQAALSEEQAMKAAYEQCLAERRVDCNERNLYPGYAAAPIVIARPHRAPRPVVPLRPTRGLTAGNVIGPGIMPGNFNGPGAITAGNVVTFAPPAPGSPWHLLR